jgi:drug/metabolite transporter (DMT)-like permease
MIAILLALGAAVSWGTSDFLGGLKSRSVALPSVLLVSQGCALALLLTFTVARSTGPPGAGPLGFAALAGVGEVVAIAALYRGLAVGTMSIVAPVAALAPVVPLFVGAITGELPSAVQFAGIALAMGGLAAASYQSSERSSVNSSPASSIGYGLLAAGGFGAFFIAMDTASEADVGWALVTARATAVTVITTVVIAQRHRITARRTDLPVLALIGVLIVAADALYATATTLGLVGIVAILGSLHTVVTIGLARFVLREELEGVQRIGIILTLAGVVAISAG